MSKRHEIARYPVTAEAPGRERPDCGFALRDIDDWAAAMASKRGPLVRNRSLREGS